MANDGSAIKNVILVIISAGVLTLVVNLGYGLAWSAWRGMTLPEMVSEMRAGAPYLVLGLFLAAVGAILGARLSAYRPGPKLWLAGLVAGAGLALVVVVVVWLQGRLNFWLPPNAVMAAIGGWLGDWLAWPGGDGRCEKT